MTDPSKADVEQARAAAQQVERASTEARPLAKDVLQRFMLVFASLASAFQPGSEERPNARANAVEFEKWSRLALRCAEGLAPYESPTFRAIMTAPAPEANRGTKVTRFTLNIFDGPGGNRQVAVDSNGQTRIIEHDPQAAATEAAVVENRPPVARPEQSSSVIPITDRMLWLAPQRR